MNVMDGFSFGRFGGGTICGRGFYAFRFLCHYISPNPHPLTYMDHRVTHVDWPEGILEEGVDGEWMNDGSHYLNSYWNQRLVDWSVLRFFSSAFMPRSVLSDNRI